MTDVLTEKERDTLLRQAIESHKKRFPKKGTPRASRDDFHQISEQFYVAVGEYFDRLPRVVMSACPYCGESVERAFDPWGIDGLWWGINTICSYDEPGACEHFQVLLGALRLGEDAVIPADMLLSSQPGPEVPFVVPRLLELPHMIAVVGELAMKNGGRAYPLAYYSDSTIEPVDLHQPWCRTEHWFPTAEGEGWTVATDPWDFDLEPYVQSEQLRWVLLDADESPPRVHRASADGPCPFVGLPGERAKQCISGGSRTVLPLPAGEPAWPFDD